MIEFKDISFVFDGKKVIEHFTDKIELGEHVALMGESGAGKSTLLNSLMGLTIPIQGEVIVDRITLSPQTIHQIRKQIAWVPQEVHMPYEYVKDAVSALFSLKVNHTITFDKEKMEDFFDQLGLEKSIFNRKMNEISGGERQRLMIVLAILLNKKILLLDEPTSAIDPTTREKLIRFLSKLNVTLLAVTHDLEFAQSCHRIIKLNKIHEA